MNDCPVNQTLIRASAIDEDHVMTPKQTQRLRAAILFVVYLLISVPGTAYSEKPETRKSRLPPELGRYQGAVFQRNMPIPFSYKTKQRGLREVTIELAGQTATATVNKQQVYVELPAISEPGGPHELTISYDGTKHVIQDVYIGDVWLCIGQSNMVFPMTLMHGSATHEPAKK